MKHAKLSFYTNTFIFALVCIGCWMVLTDFNFATGTYLFRISNIKMVKLFTVDSNILMGIAALLFAVCSKNGNCSTKIYIFKLAATSSVALTMLVTTFYLVPINGFKDMFSNSNLFFHGIIPFLSIITFVFFESNDKISFKQTFLGLIPVSCYAIFYVTNGVSHSINGYVPQRYDWYHFFFMKLKSIPIVLTIILLVSYFICFLLWKCNRKLAR